jgi:anti-sigma factor RsiW
LCEEEHIMRKSHSKPMTLDQEITALADGSLRGRRRRRADARMAQTPGLMVSLERQRRAVAALRELTPALPPKLRTRIEQERRRAGNFPQHRFP